MVKRFANRTEVGKLLAKRLAAYANRSDVLVLGLPRGGVPIAYEIAKALNVSLDICLVRKLGLPENKELAMGAIASGGIVTLNDEVVRSHNISQDTLDRVANEEWQELERRDFIYRGSRPLPNIQGRTILLVDDGIATGSTLRAAIATLKQQQPQEIIVAVPVAPFSTYKALQTEVDKVICLITPERFYSISVWYEDFSQTTDEEVQNLLNVGCVNAI